MAVIPAMPTWPILLSSLVVRTAPRAAGAKATPRVHASSLGCRRLTARVVSSSFGGPAHRGPAGREHTARPGAGPSSDWWRGAGPGARPAGDSVQRCSLPQDLAGQPVARPASRPAKPPQGAGGLGGRRVEKLPPPSGRPPALLPGVGH